MRLQKIATKEKPTASGDFQKCPLDQPLKTVTPEPLGVNLTSLFQWLCQPDQELGDGISCDDGTA
jgi:hypothetical protein